VGALSVSLTRWGYAAIFLSVVLGSVGAQIPDDAVFFLAGYLAREGRLSLSGVVVVGVLAAMVGDNLGYWIGRRLGHVVVERALCWVGVPQPRVALIRQLVARYGAVSVFLARFVSGARFLAGPLAGSAGLPPLTFLRANALGALTYVPVAVGVGYAVGEGVGQFMERLRQSVASLWLPFLTAAIVGTLLILRRQVVRHHAGRLE